MKNDNKNNVKAGKQEGISLFKSNEVMMLILSLIHILSGGWFNDRFGPKKVILVGGMLFGGGMLASGFAGSIGALIVAYGLIGGLGLGMAYGCTISSCVKFFPDKSCV